MASNNGRHNGLILGQSSEKPKKVRLTSWRKLSDVENISRDLVVQNAIKNAREFVLRNLSKTDKHSIKWSPRDTSIRGMRCYEVPGTIDGVLVNALPDWGSSVDAISEDFAKQLGSQIEATKSRSIALLGGHMAESIGRITGHFRFQGDSCAHRREFHVLRKSVHDVILGKTFLDQTKTLTKFCHRIVERLRPCIRRGSRLFLMDESPKDRLRCAVNGVKASAIPDTGSDLMLVSGDFARQNNFKIRHEKEFRRLVELIDGSIIYTDGMVLNAELQFDVPPASSRELNYDHYVKFAAGISSIRNQGRTTTHQATFTCDLHVIEDLPCDIILSNEFIFQNQVFSRFKNLFYSESTDKSLGGNAFLNDSLLYIRLIRPSFSRLRRRFRPTQNNTNTIQGQGGASWEQKWEAEEKRRNERQLQIVSSGEQEEEKRKQAEWDRNNPRPAVGAVAATVVAAPSPSSPLPSSPLTSSPSPPASTSAPPSLSPLLLPFPSPSNLSIPLTGNHQSSI